MATKTELSSGAHERIDARIDRALEGAIAPGVAVILADRDGVIYQRAAGLAIAGTDIPLAIDSVFEIGSIGKSFTAIMIMQLVREGRLDLHRPVTDYLPWLDIQSEWIEFDAFIDGQAMVARSDVGEVFARVFTP